MFRYFLQPYILGLNTHNRRKFTTVGAVGFNNFNGVLPAGVFYAATEKLAEFFAAALFAFTAGAHINYLLRVFYKFAHKFINILLSEPRSAGNGMITLYSKFCYLIKQS